MQRQAIARMIESGPIPAVHGVVRWRLIDLVQCGSLEEFRITVAKQTLSRELRAMGYRKLSEPDRATMLKPRVRSRILKKLPGAFGSRRPARRHVAWRHDRNLEFADETRIGQKNKITRRWAKRGTRPSAPRDQRTASTYIYGAVCPRRCKGAALILGACNTEAMNLHLAEIAAAVAPAAHAHPLGRRSWLAYVDTPRSSRPTSPSFCCRQNAPEP